MRLLRADSRDFLQRLAPEDAPDVVYIDPMFPPKKKSALVKMDMRVLGQLVGPDADAGELFECARAIARQRVIVKVDEISSNYRNATHLYLPGSNLDSAGRSEAF